jgi:hypothetical protein
MRLIPNGRTFSSAAGRSARPAPARSSSRRCATAGPRSSAYSGDLLGVSVDRSSTSATTAEADQALWDQATVRAGDAQHGRGAGEGLGGHRATAPGYQLARCRERRDVNG